MKMQDCIRTDFKRNAADGTQKEVVRVSAVQGEHGVATRRGRHRTGLPD
jgi:hypothetical protein